MEASGSPRWSSFPRRWGCERRTARTGAPLHRRGGGGDAVGDPRAPRTDPARTPGALPLQHRDQRARRGRRRRLLATGVLGGAGDAPQRRHVAPRAGHHPARSRDGSDRFPVRARGKARPAVLAARRGPRHALARAEHRLRRPAEALSAVRPVVVVLGSADEPPPRVDEAKKLADLRLVASEEEVRAALPSADAVYAWDYEPSLLPSVWDAAKGLRWIQT